MAEPRTGTIIFLTGGGKKRTSKKKQKKKQTDRERFVIMKDENKKEKLDVDPRDLWVRILPFKLPHARHWGGFEPADLSGFPQKERLTEV